MRSACALVTNFSFSDVINQTPLLRLSICRIYRFLFSRCWTVLSTLSWNLRLDLLLLYRLSEINWLFWVRNLFGFLWLPAFIGMMVFFLYKHFEVLLVHISILLSCMVLVQSIISAFVILKISLTDRRNAGDEAVMCCYHAVLPTL